MAIRISFQNGKRVKTEQIPDKKVTPEEKAEIQKDIKRINAEMEAKKPKPLAKATTKDVMKAVKEHAEKLPVSFKPTTKSAKGTRQRGSFEKPYEVLLKHFGEPNPPESDGSTSTSWEFENQDGKVITLYDYEATNLWDDKLPSVEEFLKNPKAKWYVGAGSQESADEFINYVNGLK